MQPLRESDEPLEVDTGPTWLLTASTQPDRDCLTSILEPVRDLLAALLFRKRPRAGLGVDETTDEVRLVPAAVTGMLASHCPGAKPQRALRQLIS